MFSRYHSASVETDARELLLAHAVDLAGHTHYRERRDAPFHGVDQGQRVRLVGIPRPHAVHDFLFGRREPSVAERRVLWILVADHGRLDRALLHAVNNERAADAAVLSFLENVLPSGAREHAVGIRPETLVLDGLTQTYLFVQILIGRTQYRAGIHAQLAEHTGVVACVDGFLVFIVEDVDRADRDAGCAAHPLAGVHDFVHEHVDRLETAAVEFRAPCIRPFVRIGALLQ